LFIVPQAMELSVSDGTDFDAAVPRLFHPLFRSNILFSKTLREHIPPLFRELFR
jgi:hypothetical protein